MKKKEFKSLIKQNDFTKLNEMKSFYLRYIILLIIISFGLLSLALFNISKTYKMSIVSPYIFIGVNSALILISALSIFFIKKIKGGNEFTKFYSFYDLLSFCLMTFSCLSFIIIYLVTPMQVSGSSMNNTYYDGDRVLVWHLAYEPKRDDVVVVDANNYYPEDELFIKRVVATKGDKVSFNELIPGFFDFYVNDSFVERLSLRQKNKITTDDEKSVLNEDGTLKNGYVLVLGDNRGNSVDSRALGAIKTEDILGKSIFRFYSKEGSFGVPKKDIRGAI